MQANPHIPTDEAVRALREWLIGMDFTHFVTFNFNAPYTLASGRKALKQFHGRLDRHIYGRYFHRFPPQQRTFFIAFPEHVHSNLHYHALLHTTAPDFTRVANPIWRKIVPSGSLDDAKSRDTDWMFECMLRNATLLLPEGDKTRIGSYITKELYLPTRYEHFVISTEFSTLDAK